MKIRRKLLLGYLGSVLIILVPFVYASLTVKAVHREFGERASKTFAAVNLLHAIQEDGLSLPAMFAAGAPETAPVVARMDSNLAAYRRLVVAEFPGEYPRLREIEESSRELRGFLARGEAGGVPSRAAAARLREALTQAIRGETEEFDRERNALLSRLRTTVNTSLVFVLAAGVAAFAFIYIFSRDVSARITEIGDAFAVAATGELERRLAVGDDELGALASSFNAMTGELRRKTVALVEAKELAEARNRYKTEFLANMSHEIRTPINSILGMLDELRFRELPKEQQRLLEVANRSAETLLHIIDEILDLSRIEAGRTEVRAKEFDLADSVRQVVDMFADRARRKGIALFCDVDEAVRGRVTGDSFRVSQVLLNLVGNAIKFTEKGEVRLRVAPEGEAAEGRRTVRFEVRDTGIGVPPEVRLRIFEPFSQADGSTTRRYGGAGLGLSISKRLVELMGGRIGVESEPGAGSLFWVTIPFGIAPAGQAEPPGRTATPPRDSEPGAPRDRPGRILLAEDNPGNQEVMTQMLARLGCRVDIAATGREAVDLYAPGRYDMVLMDYHMPVMNGIDAARRIRERFPGTRTPIVALTADVLEESRADCIAAGMDDFLTKPLRFHELQRSVERWIPPAGAPAADAEAP